MGLADRLKAIESGNPAPPAGYPAPSAPPLQQPVPNPTQIPPQNVQQVAQQQVPTYTPPQPTQAQDPSYKTPYSAPQFNYGNTSEYKIVNEKPTMGFLSAISNKFTSAFQSQPVAPNFPNTPGPYYAAVKQRIDAVIQDKNLHHFYPANSPQYNALINRVSHVDFQAIATKRRLPLELAFDLAALAVADLILYIDDSGSMGFDEAWNPSTEKTDDLKLILSRIVDIAAMFDDDGMNIRFFNHTGKFDNIRSEKEALDTLAKVKYNGGTPLGKNLVTSVFEPFVYSKARNDTFTKPVMVYIITDGVPDNKAEVRDNIRTCKQWLANTPYGKSAVSIMFAQVGNSQPAAQYLKVELDNDPDIGNDVDSTGNFEMEYSKYQAKGVDLTPDLWLLQMTLGSLVRAYDEGND